MAKDIRLEHNSNEKLARQLAGPDSNASFFLPNGERADDMLKAEKANRFNQAVEDLQDRFQTQIDAIQEAGQKIAADLQNIEIMPLSSYVLISPFQANPFQVMKTHNGIITDLGGIAPEYKSQETGEIEQEKEYVRVGMVVETGPDCRFLEPGDIVMYNINSEITVPFFKFGFVTVNENRIITVVNEKLTQRKADKQIIPQTD